MILFDRLFKLTDRSKLPSRDKLQAFVIGTGIALFPVHNTWLTQASTVNGQVSFFLPAFGAALWIIATLVWVTDNWKHLDWGDKRVWIPLVVIVMAIGISGVTADSPTDKIAPLLSGLCLLSLYLAARKLGTAMFLPLGAGAVVASLGVIAYDLTGSWRANGGFVFENNYDILVGYVLLGAVLCFHKYRWLVAGLALVGLILSGSPEAVLPLGVIGIAVLVRRDWNRYLAITLILVAVILGTIIATGTGSDLYAYLVRTARSDTTVDTMLPDGTQALGSPLSWRLDQIRMALGNLTPFGDGYSITVYKLATVHNVPLILVQQLGYAGILAALAWIWVALWALFKTRWKYVWLSIIALSVFDHYIWDQLGPVFWAVAGASLTSSAGADFIFRRTNRGDTV